MSVASFVEFDARELIGQIGEGTLWAISGGRVILRRTGVTLPVRSSYVVTVDLAADDTYTVRRVFRRAGREWVKGEQAQVYCDEVGQVAYRASCYLNGPFGEPQ